jgi:cobalt-zinc-cadmium efflux system membrane fusion protein
MKLLLRKLFATAFLCGALTGCTRAPSATTEKAATTPGPANALEITAAPSLLERVKIGETGMANVGATLTVAARLEVDDRLVARVGSPVMGRITQSTVQEGEEVRRGQILAFLNSTGLTDAQLGFLRALSQVQISQRAVARAIQLLDAGVIGSAEVQRREAEHTQATSELSAARDQLKVLGVPEESIDALERTRAVNSESRVVATIDGTVLTRKITVGQVVQPADTVFELADLSNLWLVADVPEQIAGNVSAGYSVDAEIAAFPGQSISGKLSFVSATVNPETRTVRVRMDLPNPARKYKPSMLASMVLKDQLEQKAVIPVSAVVREDNIEHVFVQLAPNRFLLRPVTLGDEYGGKRVLLDGLHPGEKIVVDGAFHLNNERRRLALRGSEGG